MDIIAQPYNDDNGINGHAAQNDGLIDDYMGKDSHVPERRCVLTRTTLPVEQLLRLAISPDDRIFPDVKGIAPGRGVWISLDRQMLSDALATGQFKGAMKRALKGGNVEIETDLLEKIDAAMAEVILSRLGLEKRSGHLVLGHEKIIKAINRKKIAALLHCSDSSTDGRRKLDWAMIKDDDSGKPQDDKILILPMNRDAVSDALGRENVVHIGIADKAAKKRILCYLQRYIMWLDHASLKKTSQEGADNAASDKS